LKEFFKVLSATGLGSQVRRCVHKVGSAKVQKSILDRSFLQKKKPLQAALDGFFGLNQF